MALRRLMLKKSIDDKRAELKKLENLDADFEAREKELETAISEITIEKERDPLNHC